MCAVDCGDPGRPENGNTSVVATTEGAVVYHTCFDGYLLCGKMERECLPTGNWSETMPSCVGKTIKLLSIS